MSASCSLSQRFISEATPSAWKNKCFFFASLPNSWRSPLSWENILFHLGWLKYFMTIFLSSFHNKYNKHITDTSCEVIIYMYNLAYTMNSHLFSTFFFLYKLHCTILLPLVIFIYFTLSVLSLTTVSLYVIWIPKQILDGTAFITVLSGKRFQCLKRPSVTTSLLWGLLQWHLNIVPLLLMA